MSKPSPLLRFLLAFDALTCLAFGAFLVASSNTTARVTGLPPGLLVEAGGFLLLFGCGVGWVASRPVPSRRAVLAIVDVNLLWAVGCALLLIFGAPSATSIGRIAVALQAFAVAGLAVLQLRLGRRLA